MGKSSPRREAARQALPKEFEYLTTTAYSVVFRISTENPFS